MIQSQVAQGKISIEKMCELAKVSRASFYRNWLVSQPQQAEMEIREAVHRVALKRRMYGYRRVLAMLKREGIVVGETVVRRILRTDNLLALRKRKFVATSDSKHGFTVHPNLAQYVKVTALNQLWVADITYLRLEREFVYLAVVLDVHSRRVVGWALGRSLQTALPLAALNQAIDRRQPGPGVVHHSDRGSQYASDDYVKRLEQMKMVISMSRPARPWENGFCESLMNTLKSEQINCVTYATLEQLLPHVEEFIEDFYNKERLHSALGYCSPVEFEQTAAISTTPATWSFPRHKEIFPDAA